jgi:hypothetical protein
LVSAFNVKTAFKGSEAIKVEMAVDEIPEVKAGQTDRKGAKAE